MDARRDLIFSGELGALMLLSHVVLGNNLVTDRFTRRRFDMPVQAWSALYAVARFPGIRAKEIAFLFPRPQNTISRALAMLEERDLIEQRSSLEDAREKLLFIRPAGECILKELLTVAEARQKELFEVLCAAELAELQRLLRKLIENPRLLSSQPMG